MNIISYLLFTILLFLSACENTEKANNKNTDSVGSTVMHTHSSHTENVSSTMNSQFEIDNKRYLFDVTENTREELSALLSRIDEIMEASPELFNELEVVMVLHGPDINYFTEDNYQQNKDLVDLAEKLDAFRVVDMKVCEASMNVLGVSNQQIPAFIETVPFAPDTLNSLREQGYINL